MEPSLMSAPVGNLQLIRSGANVTRKFPAWKSFFLVNLAIGYVCNFAGIDVIQQLRNAVHDHRDSDLSDLLIKFSMIYLMTRHQLQLRTWSESTTGLALAWIVSIMINLVVGDLLTGLVWRPGGRLLSSGCQWLSEYIMHTHEPTYVAMGLSSWLRLMAAGHIKYATAFYLLYRSIRSLLKAEPVGVAVEAPVSEAAPQRVQNDALTYSPLPAVGLQDRSTRRRSRSRARNQWR